MGIFFKYICIKLLHKVHMVFIFDKCVKIIYVMSFSCNEFFILTRVIEEGLEFDCHMPSRQSTIENLKKSFQRMGK